MRTISKLKNRKEERRRDERGMALITSLLLSTMLLTAGGALILTTSMSATNAYDSTSETQAYYAAEAGLQATLNVLRGNVGPTVLTYRAAITPADSNAAGDYATTAATPYARLSKWLTYDPNFTDRVNLNAPTPYSPLNGSAYNAVLTDPDNSTHVSFTTTGTFDTGTNTKTWVNGNGNNAPTSTLTFTGVSTSLNAYPTGATTLGTFNTAVTNGGAPIPAGSTFTLTITQTAPWAATVIINCTLTGNLTNSATTVDVDFKAAAYYGEGVLYTFGANPLRLNPPNTNSGNKTIQATLTAPEPRRILVRVNGFGPRGARKQMEIMVGRFIFNYWPRGLIAIRSADDNVTAMTFDAGSSASYTYSGNEPAGGTNTSIAGFAVTSTVDYNLISSLGATGQVTGNPAAQKVPISSLVSWLQTADEARRTLNKLQTDAKLQNRYFTNASPPPDYGTTADPAFTFMDGDATLPNGGGAGLLVCTGTLTIDGNTPFQGLILALGSGRIVRSGGGNGTSLGAFALARFDRNNWGGPFLAPTFNGNGSGTSNVLYDPDWIRKAMLLGSRYTMGVSEY
ncbi:MAG: hypothetical protein H0W99_04525 [Acidobacteria bacterium]|nr:hypothetical protein [Acidobacteriota bacterium]